MSRSIRCGTLLGTMTILLLGSHAPAAIITNPTGLNPGDPYRLVFITSTGRDAMASDIADYNAFVAGIAAAVPQLNVLGTSWTAIASTTSVNAYDNTSTSPLSAGVPIYRLDDMRVATGYPDLWDGEIENSLLIDETGSMYFGVAWTGTQADGTLSVTSALGQSTSINGVSLQTDSLWVDSGTLDSDAIASFYAISGVLTATAEAVPEPSTLALTVLGLAGLGAIAWRRKRSR